MSRPSPRVALIVPVFPVLSETFIVRQWLGLLDRGWDVHVVCQRLDVHAWRNKKALSARPELRRRVHEVGPTHSAARAALHLPKTIARWLGSPVATLRHGRKLSSKGLAEMLKRLYLDAPLLAIGPGLIHFEFGSLAPKRMDLGPLLDARIVVSFRGFDLNYVGLHDPDYYQPVWAGADGLHFLGEDLLRRAESRGYRSAKVHRLIPPAVDSSLFQPGPKDERSNDGPLRILSVGRLEWKKGYDYALRAIKLLVDRGVALTYTLVGGGSELQSLAYAQHQLGLQDVVNLIGPLPHSEVLEHLSHADVFLHPAVSEGFCNAVLEAQAMELPVVVTDADGLGENVEDGVTGFVVVRRDPEALARRLEQLAGDPELGRRMGRAGRSRVLEHFRPEQEIEAFEQLYGEALATTGA